MHPLQTRHLLTSGEGCIVHYQNNEGASVVIVAVQSRHNWAAYMMPFAERFTSESADTLTDIAARMGEKLPAVVSEAIFERFVTGWGDYRL